MLVSKEFKTTPKNGDTKSLRIPLYRQSYSYLFTLLLIALQVRTYIELLHAHYALSRKVALCFETRSERYARVRGESAWRSRRIFCGAVDAQLIPYERSTRVCNTELYEYYCCTTAVATSEERAKGPPIGCMSSSTLHAVQHLWAPQATPTLIPKEQYHSHRFLVNLTHTSNNPDGQTRKYQTNLLWCHSSTVDFLIPNDRTRILLSVCCQQKAHPSRQTYGRENERFFTACPYHSSSKVRVAIHCSVLIQALALLLLCKTPGALRGR